MAEHACLRYRLIRSEAGLLKVAKTKQVVREVSEHGGLGILGRERPVKWAVFGIKSSKRPLQMLARGKKLAELEAGRAAEPVPHIRQRRIDAIFAPLEQFASDPLRHPQRSFDKVMCILTE